MWYLSFDCATKTFAFSLSYVNICPIHINNAILELSEINTILELSEINNLLELSKLIEFAELLKKINEKKYMIKKSIIDIVDGETINLFPNIADNKILPVERVKALVSYIKSRIFENPIWQKIPKNELTILIEFQMGSNHKANIISTALITLFAEYNVELVKPSLKNKVYINEDGKHKHFIKKYSQLYSANKAHAKYNFDQIEKIFGTQIKASTSTERGHVADSFMQILGNLMF